MKLKRISIVTLKDKTLELEHNQDKHTFFSTFKYLKCLSILSMFPLYIYLLFFDISFVLRDHNGNKAVQLFCAYPCCRSFFVFRNS